MSPRIAVLAVHGVADQKHGETAQAVAALLATKGAGSLRRENRVLEVCPIAPKTGRRSVSRESVLNSARAALEQSWRSDFLSRVGPPSSTKPEFDLGTEFTDYLISKADLPPCCPATMAVVRVAAQHVTADVFEVHWADLSQVGGSVSQFLSELVTLLFRFSRLATDSLTIHSALRSPSSEMIAMTALAWTQRSAEWLFSRVICPCALQLLICPLIVLPASILEEYSGIVATIFGVVWGVMVASRLVYGTPVPWRYALPVGVVVGLLALATMASPPSTFSLHFGNLDPRDVVMMNWLFILSTCYLVFLKTWSQRFPIAFSMHLLMYMSALTTMIGLWACTAGTPAHRWTVAAIGLYETVLVAHAFLWTLEAVLLLGAIVLSWRAKLDSSASRQVLVTARLGLFTSVGAFLSLFMVGIWLVHRVLAPLVDNVPYEPYYLTSAFCGTSAADFLQQRAAAGAGSFALIALLLLGLMGFVVIVLAPSVMRELRVTASTNALGPWLTEGYRSIEPLVRVWGLPVGLATLFIASVLALTQAVRVGIAPPIETLAKFPAISQLLAVEQWFTEVSTSWLSSIVVSVAAGTVGVLALGKLAIQGAQTLRVPLDAALDVDNHFREFPRNAICRVQIMERFLAVLEHVQHHGSYDRVVIVAHSQGTVSTVETLRYLKQRSVQAGTDPDVRLASLMTWLSKCDLRLLTIGCPLRQLYALRFPDMYEWVLSKVADIDNQTCRGPIPSELGVARWTNVWSSGDYVGRWLWTGLGKTTSNKEQYGCPALDMNPEGYEKNKHRTGQDGKGGVWKDVCIGDDAHTHYFDLEQHCVATEMRALVTNP